MSLKYDSSGSTWKMDSAYRLCSTLLSQTLSMEAQIFCSTPQMTHNNKTDLTRIPVSSTATAGEQREVNGVSPHNDIVKRFRHHDGTFGDKIRAAREYNHLYDMRLVPSRNPPPEPDIIPQACHTQDITLCPLPPPRHKVVYVPATKVLPSAPTHHKRKQGKYDHIVLPSAELICGMDAMVSQLATDTPFMDDIANTTEFVEHRGGLLFAELENLWEFTQSYIDVHGVEVFVSRPVTTVPYEAQVDIRPKVVIDIEGFRQALLDAVKPYMGDSREAICGEFVRSLCTLVLCAVQLRRARNVGDCMLVLGHVLLSAASTTGATKWMNIVGSFFVVLCCTGMQTTPEDAAQMSASEIKALESDEEKAKYLEAHSDEIFDALAEYFTAGKFSSKKHPADSWRLRDFKEAIVTANATGGFVQMIGKLLIKVHARLHKAITGETYVPTDVKPHVDKANSWMDRTSKVLAEYTDPGFLRTPADRKRVSELYKEGLALHVEFSRLPQDIKSHLASFHTFHAKITGMQEIVSSLNSRDRRRPLPFTVVLKGQNGTGKTPLIDFVCELGEKLFNRRPGEPMKFSKNVAAEFWDGYKLQPVVQFDDLWQIAHADRQIPAAEELFNLISTGEHQLTMSRVEEKSNTFMASEMFVITTNSEIPPNHVNFTEPEALMKRMHLVLRVEVDEDARVNQKGSKYTVRIPKGHTIWDHQRIVIEHIAEKTREVLDAYGYAYAVRQTITREDFVKITAAFVQHQAKESQRQIIADKTSWHELIDSVRLPDTAQMESPELSEPGSSSSSESLFDGQFEDWSKGYLRGQPDKPLPNAPVPELVAQQSLNTRWTAYRHEAMLGTYKVRWGGSYPVFSDEVDPRYLESKTTWIKDTAWTIGVSPLHYLCDKIGGMRPARTMDPNFKGVSFSNPHVLVAIVRPGPSSALHKEEYAMCQRWDSKMHVMDMASRMLLDYARNGTAIVGYFRVLKMTARISFTEACAEVAQFMLASLALSRPDSVKEVLSNPIANTTALRDAVDKLVRVNINRGAHIEAPVFDPIPYAHKYKDQTLLISVFAVATVLTSASLGYKLYTWWRDSSSSQGYYSADEIVRRQKQKKLTRKSYVHGKAPWKSQSGFDSAYDELATLLRKSMVRVTTRSASGRKGTVHGLRIKDKYLLTTYHSLSLALSEELSGYDPDASMDITEVDKLGKVTTTTFTFAALMSAHPRFIVSPAEADWALVRLPPQFQSSRDLLSHFSDSNMPHVGEGTYRLLRLDRTGLGTTSTDAKDLRHQTHMHYTLDGLEGSVEISSGFVSNVFTGAGDCGSLYIANDPHRQNKVYGIHCAGNGQATGSRAIGCYVSRQDLEAAIAELEPTQDVAQVSVGDVVPPNLPVGRVLEKRFGTRYPSKSNMVPSPASSYLPPSKGQPVNLAAHDGISPISNMVRTLETQPTCEPDQAEVDTVMEHLVNLIGHDTNDIRRVLTDDEAINGVPGEKYIGAMRMDTSSGYVGVLARTAGKYHLFTVIDGKYVMCELAANAVAHLEHALDNKEMIEVVVIVFPKDERRSEAKIDTPRGIKLLPMEINHVSKKLLGAFGARVMKRRMQIDSTLGINPHSSAEWTELAMKHDVAPDENVCSNVDAKAQDVSMSKRYILGAMRAINRWYGDSFQHRRLWLAELLSHPLFMVQFTLYLGDHGNLSGWWFTALMATLAEACNVRISYYHAGKDEKKFVGQYGLQEALADFDRRMRRSGNGDDTLNTNLPGAGWFTPDKYALNSRNHCGFVMTPSKKDDPMDVLRPFKDMVYLKRKFVKDPTGFYRAPLDEDTIADIPLWTTMKSPPLAHQQALFDTALREWFHHGEEKFLSMRRTYCDVARHLGPAAMPTLTYDRCYQDWMNSNYDPQSDLEVAVGQHASFSKDMLDAYAQQYKDMRGVAPLPPHHQDGALDRVPWLTAQMDTSVPEPEEVVAIEGLTKVVDTAPPQISDPGIGASLIRPICVNPYPPLQVSRALGRLYPIHEGTWTSSSAQLLHTYSLPGDLFAVPAVRRLLDYAEYFRCESVEVSVRFNATPFHFGMAALSAVGHHRYAQVNGVGHPCHDPDPRCVVQTPHELCDPSTGSTYKLVTNWNIPYPWLPISSVGAGVNQEIIASGKLTVFNKLHVASGPSVPPVRYTLYARFIKPEVAGPVPTLAPKVVNTFRAQMDEGDEDPTAWTTRDGFVRPWENVVVKNDRAGLGAAPVGATRNPEADAKSSSGMITAGLRVLSTISGAFSWVPVFGPVAKVISVAATAASFVTQWKGLDKPTSVHVSNPTEITIGRGLANVNGLDNCIRLAADSTRDVPIDATVSGVSTDDYNIVSMAMRPALLQTFLIDASMAPGALVAVWSVGPNAQLPRANTSDPYQPSPAFFVSQYFDFWRGDWMFYLQVVCSQYTTARVRLVWFPIIQSAIPTMLDQVSGDLISQVVDITKGSSVPIRIPYFQAMPWLHTQTSAEVTYATNNGTFAVYVEVAPTVGIDLGDSTIYLNMYSAAAENVQFASPREPPMELTLGQTPDAGKLRAQVNMVDEFRNVSFQSLLPARSTMDDGFCHTETFDYKSQSWTLYFHRYAVSARGLTCVNSNAQVNPEMFTPVPMVDYTRPSQTAPETATGIELMMTCFQGWRGAIRVATCPLGLASATASPVPIAVLRTGVHHGVEVPIPTVANAGRPVVWLCQYQNPVASFELPYYNPTLYTVTSYCNGFASLHGYHKLYGTAFTSDVGVRTIGLQFSSGDSFRCMNFIGVPFMWWNTTRSLGSDWEELPQKQQSLLPHEIYMKGKLTGSRPVPPIPEQAKQNVGNPHVERKL